jgi:hypothetical protein
MELHEQCNGLRDTLRANILNLNLGFLVTAQQLVLNGCLGDARLFLGVREPLLSWLRKADVTTLCTLARSPDLLYEVRLPPAAEGRILAACDANDEARWVARMHIGLWSTGRHHEQD